MSPHVGRALRDATTRLADAGVATPRADAELLLAHALGTSRGDAVVRATRGERLDPATSEAFSLAVERRAGRVPLQHLTGTTGFRGIDLDVGPGVFVPRPETEVVAGVAIAEAARVAAARPTDPPLVVDLCSGSGAIALSVADEVPGAVVHAVEVDAAALAYAARTLTRLRDSWRLRAGGTTPQPAVTLHESDVAVAAAPPDGPLAPLLGQVDVVVANPPYLPDAGESALDPEVRDHDPRAALFGGPDGLTVVRTVVAVAADLLRPGGLLVCEHADEEGAPGSPEAVRDLLVTGWTQVATGEDLAGRPRYATARRADGASR